MILTLPPSLDAITLGNLISQWPQHACELELHFNKSQWARPTGMVGLACLIDRFRKNGGTVRCEAGNCGQVGYWERMGFFREVRLPAPDCASGTPRPPEGRFAEIRRVGDINLVDAITEELVEATQTSEDAVKTFRHILSETMNNVCQHSRAFGFSAAQYWKQSGQVEFCIADSGIGLFEALMLSHSPANDADAIRLALKVGVTSRSPTFGQPGMRNRGVGLSCAERLVSANGGRFEIWSGRGRFTNASEGPQMTSNPPWTGTLITVNMQRDRLTADFQAVMQQLTAELRLVEAETPGSRRSVRQPRNV